MRNNHLLYLAFFLISFSCKPDDVVPITDPTSAADLLAIPISINMNPNQITPLAGWTQVRTKKNSTVSFEIQGNYPVTRSSTTPSTRHTFDVLGLYPNVMNEIIFTITDTESGKSFNDTLNILGATLPNTFPTINVITNEEDQRESGWNLIEMSVGGNDEFLFYPIMFDPEGNIRWYMDLSLGNWIGPIQRLQNDNWLWASGDKIYEYSMLGAKVNEWSINGYWQHHDIIEKSNGNFIVPVSKSGLSTGLDHIIEVDRSNGNILKTWDLREVLDIDRYDLVMNVDDWLHVNSVWYDDADGGLVISGRHQAVFKVSTNNDLEWILAPNKGWGKAGADGNGIQTSNYLLTAVDENGIPFSNDVQIGNMDDLNFGWSWGQHACMILPSGNLFCFDNGWRKFFSNTANAGYIRGVEYKVDPTAMTVQQIWQYGKERGGSIYSGNISDVDLLPQTGNRLICPGNIYWGTPKQARMIEVTHPDGNVVFEAAIEFKNTLSSGGGWMQADLVYRMERLPLY